MSTHLYLASAASGKTAYVLALAQKLATGLAATPRIVVPTHLQARGGTPAAGRDGRRDRGARHDFRRAVL